MREIEIKLEVDSFERVRDRLLKKGWIPIEKLHQADFIYVNNGISFKEIKSGTPVTRLRVQDKSKYFLNVKVSQSSELDCIEHESQVDNAIEVKKILKLLGLNEVMRVSKHRETGTLDDYTVCLDKVDDLGSFVEFEALISDTRSDMGVVRAKMLTDITALDLGTQEEVLLGYDTLLYSKTVHNT
jgi:adenylate cyclase class 2